MYVGHRDAHLVIKVPMSLCFLVSMAGVEWIEVMIPPSRPERMSEPWLSMVVRPNQVFWLDDTFNIIEGINAHTQIRLCEHFTDAEGYRRIIEGSDLFVDPQNIIDNFNEYNKHIIID
jgi:hypothetical protein